jgi:hypothetical protein
MNWSEMFSSRLMVNRDEPAMNFSSGPRVSDDLFYLTIRWQDIFLDLCAPMQSLCYFLGHINVSDQAMPKRKERITRLLRTWVNSEHGRRSLIHASTILTLYQIAKQAGQRERVGPPTAHAVYSALAVIAVAFILLRQNTVKKLRQLSIPSSEELVLVRDVWCDMLQDDSQSISPLLNSGRIRHSKEHNGDADSNIKGREVWLWVQYWHRRFEYIGMAGIFSVASTNPDAFADWQGAPLHGLNTAVVPNGLAAILRQRYASFAGEPVQPVARRGTVDGSVAMDHRKQSQERSEARYEVIDSSTLPEHSMAVMDHASASQSGTDTRRWILHGTTEAATFCGLKLACASQPKPSKSKSKYGATSQVGTLTQKHLRQMVYSFQKDQPLWCYSGDYASLLLGALHDDSDCSNAHP